MTLPKDYIAGVPRVSELVSYMFPFEGESEQRYLEWLNKNNISPEDYMKEAQDVGTFVHLQMENYVNNINIDTTSSLYALHKVEIDLGIEWLKQLNEEGWKLKSEVLLLDEFNRFQGTTDLVFINEEKKKVRVYDFKTYGIAKKKFGLPNNYRKPYDKLKKVGAQLSFYSEVYRQMGYEVEGIFAIILHESGLYEEKLSLMTTDEINKIITSFIVKDIPLPAEMILIINYKQMKIEVQTTIPGEAYSKAGIIIEENDFEGMSYEGKIKEAITLQKFLISQYKQ